MEKLDVANANNGNIKVILNVVEISFSKIDDVGVGKA